MCVVLDYKCVVIIVAARGNEYQVPKILDFPDGSAGKESACNAGDTEDMGLIPGSGRAPGGGNCDPLQYSCLKNPMDRGVWKATVQKVLRVRNNWATQHALKEQHREILKLSNGSGRVPTRIV